MKNVYKHHLFFNFVNNINEVDLSGCTILDIENCKPIFQLTVIEKENLIQSFRGDFPI